MVRRWSCFELFAKAYGLAGLEIGYALMPKAHAQAMRAQGLGNPHLFTRFAIVAATASLRHRTCLGRVSRAVAAQREQWFRLFRELQLRHTPSSANVVFFDTGNTRASFAAALLTEGIEIRRVFPPDDQWARISIGLAQETDVARAALRSWLSRSVSRG